MKRILIVDDDKEILTMLDYGLKKLGPNYEVVTALGSVEALQKIEKDPIDLLVTDYMMKDMTGVDLARAVRSISPHTQVILMSAYGSKRLRATTQYLGFDGYLDKPFDVMKMREIVKNAVGEPEPSLPPPVAVVAKPSSEKATIVLHKIQALLQRLLTTANARCVLLLTAGGHPAQLMGQTNGLNISNISAVIAANFMSTTELANLLGNRSIFTSSFHAGDDYNLYVHDVNGAFLLAVVFDAQRKPGVIWFYTKQAAAALGPLLKPRTKPLVASPPVADKPGEAAA
jgi:CheY-like chemotaxis protein